MKQENKYRNKRIENTYGEFDSIKEWRRYMWLLNLQKFKQIEKLQRQVVFLLIPSQRDSNGKIVEKSCSYVADFTYYENGKLVVEDVKSEITRSNAAYIIKRKLMLYQHNIRIKEV